MITQNQMTQFVTVVRNHSITKAAEELFIAQPAISATIKKIEKELSVDLFTYENKQMHLTPEGEKVYAIMKDILALYQQLDEFSTYSSKDVRTIPYYAAPSIHQMITPQLELFDVFPNYNFSMFDCTSLKAFRQQVELHQDCLGIFHILDPFLEDVYATFSDCTIEHIASTFSSVLTSYKNTSSFAKKESCTFDEIKQLPMLRVTGTDHSIHHYLKDAGLNYVMDVTNSLFVDTILFKKPELFSLGHNLFTTYNEHRLISIPITDLPKVNLIYIYKCTTNNGDVFSRISAILRSLFAN